MIPHYQKNSALFRFFLSIGFVLTLFICCEIDHGLKPIQSKIGGKITFIGDRVPRDTDEVRVAVVTTFPPGSISELLFSDMIPFKKNDTTIVDTPVPWEIYLPPGTYEMTGVIWKENNESWNISDVIGIYGTKFFGEIPDGLPKPITVPNSSSVIDTIDIEANLNRVNRDGKISGTITFKGDWPGNTGVIGIGAFTDIPQQGNIFDYFFKNIALAYGIAINVQSTDYLLRVRSDNPIQYVAVLWINDSFDLTSIKDVGFYTDPQDATKPGTVIVQKNSTQSGINITVDFSKF